jgi:TPP-dependent pyruvate/acetoin dehydrogenase alpha subunit
MKGVPLSRLAGRAKGGPRKNAARLESAMAAAERHRASRNGKVAVVFLSMEKVPPAKWHEALQSAEASKLPVLFVCHGGEDAERASTEPKGGDRGVALRTQSHGFAEIAVDANDVVAVYRVACEAIAHARKGNGPTLIECRLCSLNGRSPAAEGNRGDPDRGALWNDPILKMERYLAGKGLFPKQLKTGIAARFRRNLNASLRAGGKSPIL